MTDNRYTIRSFINLTHFNLICPFDNITCSENVSLSSKIFYVDYTNPHNNSFDVCYVVEQHEMILAETENLQKRVIIY